MGLDMYLYTNSKKVCKAANAVSGSEEWRVPRGIAVYWRKANAIHNWFVDHVQFGEDDCGTYEVEVEQLIELRDTCRRVLVESLGIETTDDLDELVKNAKDPDWRIENTAIAEELMPTTSGFFFGGTEYDLYYMYELARTACAINVILDNIEQYKLNSVAGIVWDEWREKGDEDEWNVTFHYHASW